jgi:hypothetical protein
MGKFVSEDGQLIYRGKCMDAVVARWVRPEATNPILHIVQDRMSEVDAFELAKFILAGPPKPKKRYYRVTALIDANAPKPVNIGLEGGFRRVLNAEDIEEVVE